MILSKFNSLMSFYAGFAQPFSTFHTETNSTRIIFTAGAHLKAGGGEYFQMLKLWHVNPKITKIFYLTQDKTQITLQGEKSRSVIPVLISHQSCWELQMCLWQSSYLPNLFACIPGDRLDTWSHQLQQKKGTSYTLLDCHNLIFKIIIIFVIKIQNLLPNLLSIICPRTMHTSTFSSK